MGSSCTTTTLDIRDRGRSVGVLLGMPSSEQRLCPIALERAKTARSRSKMDELIDALTRSILPRCDRIETPLEQHARRDGRCEDHEAARDRPNAPFERRDGRREDAGFDEMSHG